MDGPHQHAADSTRRAQTVLVLARAEAANIPVHMHSFGYGRSHNPASPWLMSNHTSGTYTFVKDWCDLRGCLAGYFASMMSIGLLNMKLHMAAQNGATRIGHDHAHPRPRRGRTTRKHKGS